MFYSLERALFLTLKYSFYGLFLYGSYRALRSPVSKLVQVVPSLVQKIPKAVAV